MHRRVLNALFLLDCDRMSPESGCDDDDDEEDAVGVNVRGDNDVAELPPAAIANPVDNPLLGCCSSSL
jgi:hypothetical protein